MQFTKAESYGLRGVIYLARAGADKVVPLSEIAKAEDVPEKFLAKIFQNLTRAGIVRSHRGIRGGFSMINSPDHVTARQIIEAIQGPQIRILPGSQRAKKSRIQADGCL